MGHANVKNISVTVNRMLHARESVSIKEIIAELQRRKQTVHAGEGEYEEDYMLAMATEQVIDFLRRNKGVEAVDVTRKQSKILAQWDTDEMAYWDNGDDGMGGEYGVLDSIKWRALKRRLPVLRYVTN